MTLHSELNVYFFEGTLYYESQYKISEWTGEGFPLFRICNSANPFVSRLYDRWRPVIKPLVN
jgi:hypothetical protein